MAPVYWHAKRVGYLPSDFLWKDSGVVRFALLNRALAFDCQDEFPIALDIEQVSLRTVEDQSGEPSAFQVEQYADLTKLKRIRGFVPEDSALTLLYPQEI